MAERSSVPVAKVRDVWKIFAELAGRDGASYEDVFLRIQKATLGSCHINKAALRGSWLLFTIGFVIDLVAAVNAALVF